MGSCFSPFLAVMRSAAISIPLPCPLVDRCVDLLVVDPGKELLNHRKCVCLAAIDVTSFPACVV